MKKLLIQLLSIAFVFTSTTSSAQLLRAAGTAENNAMATSGFATISKATFKATQKFMKEFKNVEDASWLLEEKVITAVFDRNDINTRVAYNKNGRWLYTIKTYKEVLMPRSERNAIKYAYPDDQITLVHEVNEGPEHLYIVHLENKTQIRQVIIKDGELTLYKEFVKSE